MDTRANDATALADRLQRQGNEIADGRIDDGRIERLRRLLVGAARPCHTEAPGEGLGSNITRPGEGKHRSPLPLCDLRDDMGRGSEAVEPQFLALSGHRQRTPADQSGAEQRRERHVAADLAERKRIACIGDRRRCKAAVARIAGEERTIAQVFPSRHAIGTDAAGMAEPRNADALTHAQPLDALPDRIDPADDLVAWDDRHNRVGQLAIDDMQVRATDAAGGHYHSDLAWPGLPIGEICPF